MPKMPTLGYQPRRKSGSGKVVFLLLAAGAGGGYFWWNKHKTLTTAQAVVASAPVAAAPVAVPTQAVPTQAVVPQAPIGQPAAAPGVAPIGLPSTTTAAAPVVPAQPAGPRHIMVTVDGPLEQSIVANTSREVGPALTQVVTRALVWWISVPGDLRKNDKLDVIYEERGSEEPQVDAVRLVSGKFNKTYEAYRFKADGEQFSRFYSPDGNELEQRLRNTPVDGYEQITSLIRDGRHHKGVDFKTPVGTKVKATFAGTLTRKNWNWHGNGNCLELTEDASPHRKALYLHLSELPKSLQMGKKVGVGEVIADSGNTGHSFAPHLHYQLMQGEERVLDPFDSQPAWRRSLAAAFKPQLDTQVAKWQSMMAPTMAATGGSASP